MDCASWIHQLRPWRGTFAFAAKEPLEERAIPKCSAYHCRGATVNSSRWFASFCRDVDNRIVISSAHRPVPRHIAFIMDGNRRYAEARQLRKVEGHAYGYQRLIDALEWCLELGVSCVSVYAFSIDNYRRSGEEVSTLMELAEEKLAHMLQVRGCVDLVAAAAPPAA